MEFSWFFRSVTLLCSVVRSLDRLITWARCLPVVTAESG